VKNPDHSPWRYGIADTPAITSINQSCFSTEVEQNGPTCGRFRDRVANAALYRCRWRSAPQLLRGAERRFSVGTSGFELILHAVAFSLDDYGFRVVQQTVKDGRGKRAVIVEDFRPLLVCSV